MENLIKVQTENFDQNAVYRWLAENHRVGATTVFVGKVREMNLGDSVSGLYLEHYPAMTEKALNEIVTEARQRWELERVVVIHRIMDYLKTKAPFWKRETTAQGDRWVEERESDLQAAEKWQ